MDDPRISTLKNVAECVNFERNALAQGRRDLANAAKRRAIQIRAEQRAREYGAATQAERECLQAVYAYEEVLRARRGKRTAASRTWQMINRHGIIGAVERAVNRSTETLGYSALHEMGLDDMAFEAVVVRYPELFSATAVTRAKDRISRWKGMS